MVKLTSKCRYALRALRVLAREYGNGTVVASRISLEANVPPEFLQLILLDLKKAGIVATQRGSNGGYRLIQEPDRVTFGAIIRIIDGPLMTLACASAENGRICEDCRSGDACQVRQIMREVQSALAAILDTTTLGQRADAVELSAAEYSNGFKERS